MREPDDVLTRIEVTTYGKHEQVWEGKGLQELVVRNMRPTLSNCLTLDLSRALVTKDSAIKTVLFAFRQNCEDCKSARVVLEERAMATTREIGINSLANLGPDLGKEALKVDKETGKGWATYVVQINENVYVENDPSKNCKNYPYNGFGSYNDCDEHFISTTLKKSFGPEFVPVWAANVTSKTSSVKWANSTDYDINDLFEGVELSQCHLPCTTTNLVTRFLAERFDDESIIKIIFGESMTVTTTDFVKFNIVTFLSDVGGAMGLWLGLGIIQFLQLVVRCSIIVSINITITDTFTLCSDTSPLLHSKYQKRKKESDAKKNNFLNCRMKPKKTLIWFHY